jgi:hypothetical protein
MGIMKGVILMKKALKVTGIIIDILAFTFNMFMLILYVYALTQGYKPRELDMEWMGVLHGICINGAWAFKYFIGRIIKFWKWFKARKK